MGLSFEDLDEDLSCFILEKLINPVYSEIPLEIRNFDPKGMASLATFACASRHCARLVRERAWEAACRKAAPEVCARVSPPGAHSNGPGGANWISFAKLLNWCPGQYPGEVERTRAQEMLHAMPYCQAEGPMHTCVPINGHMSPEQAGVEVVSSSLFVELPTCRSELYMLCCTHEFMHNYGFVDTNKIERRVYRGFIFCVDEWAAAHGIKPPLASQSLGLCPFCAVPLRKVPRDCVDLTMDFAADFQIYEHGHVIGLVERVVQPFSIFVPSDPSDESEPSDEIEQYSDSPFDEEIDWRRP